MLEMFNSAPTYADTKHILAHPKQNAHAYIKAHNYCRHKHCSKITAYIDISLLRQHPNHHGTLYMIWNTLLRQKLNLQLSLTLTCC